MSGSFISSCSMMKNISSIIQQIVEAHKLNAAMLTSGNGHELFVETHICPWYCLFEFETPARF